MGNWINTYVNLECNKEEFDKIVGITKEKSSALNYVLDEFFFEGYNDAKVTRIHIKSKTGNPADYLNTLEELFPTVNFSGFSNTEGYDDVVCFEYKDGADRTWEDTIKEESAEE